MESLDLSDCDQRIKDPSGNKKKKKRKRKEKAKNGYGIKFKIRRSILICKSVENIPSPQEARILPVLRAKI